MRVDDSEDWEELPEGEAGPAILPDEQEVEPRPRWRRWKIILYLSFVLIVLILAWLTITAPLSKSLQPIAAPSITLVSAEGDPIARRGAMIGAPVRIADLPKHVPAAFISIEDRGFYDHIGISVRGIARATVRNLTGGRLREGGSTITQQLAKVSFLSSERTATRKLQEVFISFWLEGWLTKDEILERYLSNVYFGDNAYGLRAASEHYFSVPPERLSIPQAAMLAGLVKAPSRLAPTNDLKGARARAKLVIGAMVRDGVLTQAAADRLKPARLRVGDREEMPTGTYFADWVLPVARARGEIGYGEQKVETTLESRLQRLAVQAVRRAPLGNAQVALVAMRPDGRVVAMVGGKNYARSPFNRATQARRQPGSAFKLFVYLAALRSGMSPDDMVEDKPLTIDNWKPQNYGGRYRGAISLKDAFASSSNVAAVRLSEQVGRANVIRAARDLGVASPLGDQPSLALGTSGVTLLEMTAAYAAVAADRYPVRPEGLPAEEEGWLSRLWNGRNPSRDRNLEVMKELLFAAANQGTGRSAALSVPTFGKTGTTQDSRDAIFIGFAGDLVVGVWIGNDDNSPLPGGMAGGGLPARIWRDFMSSAIHSEPVRAAPPRPVPMDIEGLNGSITIPIEGTGVDLGVELDQNGMTISAQPSPTNEVPPAEDVPNISPPPLPRTLEDAPVDGGRR